MSPYVENMTHSLIHNIKTMISRMHRLNFDLMSCQKIKLILVDKEIRSKKRTSF